MPAPFTKAFVSALVSALIVVLLAAALALGAQAAPEVPLPPPDPAFSKASPDPSRPARPIGEQYEGPVIDVHAHLLMARGKKDLKSYLIKVWQTGVSNIIFLPTPNEGRMRQRKQSARHRRTLLKMGEGSVSLLCGSTSFTVWMQRAYTVGRYGESDLRGRLKKLSRDIDSGTCLGIGEIGPYHFDKKPGMAQLTLPMNFAPFLRLAGLAEQKGVWMDIHAEPVTPQGDSFEDEVFAGYELLFKQYPDIKIVLAHTGMMSPANARLLFSRHKNLMMHLKIVTSPRLAWGNLWPITNSAAELYEDWAELMEEYPDRFMVGTDARFGTKQYKKNKYQKVVVRTRRILGTLTPDAAEMIAYGNAKRIYFSK